MLLIMFILNTDKTANRKSLKTETLLLNNKLRPVVQSG